jgi:archaellum component FlaF (FlaF/FlaG flagellin family)
VKRRGVSEIISTIIIILIVSVAGTYLFSYSIGRFQDYNDDYFRETELVIGQARERFNVPAVWWDQSSNLLNITVYNFGEIDLSISDVYINGIRVTSYSSGRDTKILTGSLHQLVFNSPVSISDGEEYRIRVVSNRGVVRVFDWKS